MEGVMPVKPGTQAHIETYAMNIARELDNDPELRHYPPQFIEAVCRSLAYRVRPIVDEIEKTENRFVFRVISPPIASFVGGCMGNDTNVHLHTGEAAITQSNALFAICTDTVMRSYGEGQFTLAEPLEFRTALPFGVSVIVTIEIGPRKRITKGTIEVKIEENGKLVFPEGKIRMVKKIQKEEKS
jgi:hypothetical protein